MKFPKSSLTTSKSPSLIIQVSYLCGLLPTLNILIYKGYVSVSDSAYAPGTGEQGDVLQVLVKIATPLHLDVGSVPTIHTLCKV